ncbi:MAG: Dna2/Cas4 domain-containing protein [Chloroflexota bacterium]|nr:Dna2/Cas4 domain-containing protein [Chloroflexota bacterium]
MPGLLVALFLVAFAAALVLFALARAQREQTGLPANARIVYADTGAWKKVEQALFSRRYALTGKPDYIVENGDAIIPVEVKPNRVAPAPRESDVMQLAAYGLLIEETWGQGRAAPPYGLLKYRDTVFQIDFTGDLRAELIDLMDAMRRDLAADDVARSHTEPRRCRACGYRAECGQILDDG